MTRRPEPPIHALPVGGPPLPPDRDHRATTTCWCAPVVARDLLVPARLVLIHRNAR